MPAQLPEAHQAPVPSPLLHSLSTDTLALLPFSTMSAVRSITMCNLANYEGGHLVDRVEQGWLPHLSTITYNVFDGGKDNGTIDMRAATEGNKRLMGMCAARRITRVNGRPL